MPAGTIDAFRLEARGWQSLPNGVQQKIIGRSWFAPDQVRLPVLRELERTNQTRIIEASRNEMVSFKEG